MPLLIYSVTAVALLALTHRFVQPVSRRAAVILFLLPFIYTGKALVLNRVYGPIDRTYAELPLSDLRADYGIGPPHNPMVTDIYSQMYPWRHVVREALRRGEWPLWNPYMLCGDILAASAQSAPYSPFTLIACLMPSPLSFTFTAAITLFLYALCAWAFARELGCGEPASLVAAAGSMCATNAIFYVLWPLGHCWAYLPFVFLGTRRCVRTPGVRAAALLATALTLTILAGHPESVLHIVATGGVYGLFELAQRWRSALRPLAAVIAAGVVALLLCAIYLLPILEAIPQTAEYDYRHAIFARADWRSAAPLDVGVRLATEVLPFLYLRDVESPRIGQLKGEIAIVGSIMLALAAYAVWRIRSRDVLIFAALGIFLALAATEFGPITRMFQRMPFFDIALNERLAFGAACCFVVVGTLGADALAKRPDRIAAAATFAALLLILGGATWYLTHHWVIAWHPADFGAHKIPAELGALAVAIVLFAPRVPARVIVPALFALVVMQRFVSEAGIWFSFPQRAAYPPVPVFEPLKNVREPFRVVARGFAMVPQMSAMYGLEDARGYEAMTLDTFHRTYPLWAQVQSVWFNRVDDLNTPWLSMMNVRFAIDSRSEAVPPGWREVVAHRGTRLLENLHVLPRAFVPRNVTRGLMEAVATDEMRSTRDFRERAWIDDTDYEERQNGPGTVSIARPKMNEYLLDARMESDGWVVLTESFWKGWRGYVDGRRVKLRRTNITFQAIFVPAGHHTVRFVYWPQSFVIGRTITFATLLLLVLYSTVTVRVIPLPRWPSTGQ